MKAVFASLTFLLFAASSLFASKENLIIVNHVNKSIHRIYVSEARAGQWQDDLLGEDVIIPGETVKVTFENRHRACVWDVKVVDLDGVEYAYPSVNLCELSTITVK